MKPNAASAAGWPLATWVLSLLAAPGSVADSSIFLQRDRSSSHSGGDYDSAPKLDEVVMRRAEENLEMATYANSESKNNLGEVLVTQQTMKASKALDDTLDAFDIA